MLNVTWLPGRVMTKDETSYSLAPLQWFPAHWSVKHPCNPLQQLSPPSPSSLPLAASPLWMHRQLQEIHTIPGGQDAARWRSGATKTEPCLFSIFFPGKHQWEEWICMSGRLCQWVHWEGWVSGWSRGSSPVSAQSTTKASEITTDTSFYPTSDLKPTFLFWFPCVRSDLCWIPLYSCVGECVRADQVDLRLNIASTHRLHSADEDLVKLEIADYSLLQYTLWSAVLDLQRGGEGSRSSVVLLGELSRLPFYLTFLFQGYLILPSN